MRRPQGLKHSQGYSHRHLPRRLGRVPKAPPLQPFQEQIDPSSSGILSKRCQRDEESVLTLQVEG